MITANDLKNIDFFLAKQEAIINQPKDWRKVLKILRELISSELNKIKIKVEKN